jgi:hypothetical protein
MGIYLCTELAGGWCHLRTCIIPHEADDLDSITITNKQFELEMNQFVDFMGLGKAFPESFCSNWSSSFLKLQSRFQGCLTV